MQLNKISGALAAVGLVALMGVAYYMGAKNREQQAAAPAVRPMQAPISPNAEMPQTQNHAGLQQQGQAGPAQAGKVEVDPNAKFTHFRVGNRNVKAILMKGDVAWVGTSGGVVRYDTKTDDYRLFDVRNGLLSNGIFSIDEIGGRIMVGTYGGGMSLYDEKQDKWENFNIPQGLGDAFVYRVMQASNGDVWVATWSGANRIRGGVLNDRSKWDLYTVENTKGGLPNDWVYGLAEGKNGDIWMATEGGLALYRNGKWENWNHAKGLGAPYEKVKNDIKFTNDPAQQSTHHAKQKEEMGLQGINVAYNPNYIVSMVVDAEGIVWAGTWGGGLSRFDGKNWRHYTVAEGLPGNHVFMLHIDKKGQMWVGTNAGLARKDGEKFVTMTTEHGLFSDTVFSMATADNGNLWVGSFGGVARLKGGL